MAVKRKFPVRVATVYCNGGCRANKTDGTPDCQWGCLGCSVCVDACKFDAIHLNEYGVAEVDEEKCIGCGLCARKCPRGIIRVREQGANIVVLCSNEDKGKAARDVCSVSCIGCGLCVKNCPATAISLVNNHAVIDEALCLSCGMCATVCPRHAIIDKDGIITAPR